MAGKEGHCVVCGRTLARADDKIQISGEFYCKTCYDEIWKKDVLPRGGVTTFVDNGMLVECNRCGMIATLDKLREDENGKFHCPKCDHRLWTVITSKSSAKNDASVKNEDYSTTAQLFKCLGDPSRIKIIELLSDHELYVFQFVEMTGLQYAAVSYHLKILKDLDLIRSFERGNFMIYSLTNKGETVHEVIKKSKSLN